MLDNLNIRQKGLLLVGVPCLLQTVLAALLVGQVFYCQSLARSAIQSEQRVAASMRMTANAFNMSKLLFMQRMTHNPDFMEGWHRAQASGRQMLEFLVASAESPIEMEAANNNLTLTQESDLIWDQQPDTILDSYFDGTGDMLSMCVYANITRKVINIFYEMVDIERDREVMLTQRIAGGNQMLRDLLICNCLSGILATAVIGFLFHRSLVVRLRVLVDNTVRVARGVALNHPVSGRDEIACLDQSIRSMNTSLQSAEAFRQEVVGMISHDLRTPLMSVSMYFESLLAGLGGKLTPVGEKRVIAARGWIDGLAKLIDDLLDAEKMRAGKLAIDNAAVDMATVVRECQTTLSELASNRCVVVEVSVSGKTLVTADRGRLVQVVSNLLSNAIKFSPEQGRILVSLSNDEESCLVRIIDEGPGVPAGDTQRIFERFEQTGLPHKESVKGSGLGLSISRAIVEAHGGQIGVLNGTAGGACFWFRLPLAVKPESVPQ